MKSLNSIEDEIVIEKVASIFYEKKWSLTYPSKERSLLAEKLIDEDGDALLNYEVIEEPDDVLACDFREGSRWSKKKAQCTEREQS